MYMPRFLVTQEVFDAASTSERQKYNYVVDERTHSLPKNFSLPNQGELVALHLLYEVPIID
jgi:hypothetical protein